MTQSKDQFELLESKLQDPEFFVEDVLGAHFWDKQIEIAKALATHDDVAVRSCHAIGKSFTAARLALWFLYAFPESVVWSTAPTARQVYNILWREIRGAHEASITPLGGTMLKQRLDISALWYAFGFATKDGVSFQGLHAKSGRILGIVDEASGMAEQIMEASEGTLTSQFAKRLMLGNANKRTGYFAQSFKNPRVYKIKISAYDTPNFKANDIKNADDLLKFDKEKGIDNAVIVAPHLITPKFAYGILLRYGRNSTNFHVRVEAEFPTADSDTLISLDLIENAFNREIEEDQSKEIGVIACDPARFGDDRTGIIIRQGLKVIRKVTMTKLDNVEVGNKLLSLKREFPTFLIKVEVNGLGTGVLDHVKHQIEDIGFKKKDVIEVNVNEKAVDPEYANIRTEIWATAAEWLKVGSLPEDEDFREGADVKYKFTSKGQQQLEAKDDIKKRIGKSPDVLDALAISFYEGHKIKEPNIRVL